MIRLYRALLHAYPASFRAEYGDELADIFAQRVEGKSVLASGIQVLRDAVDLIPRAFALHGFLLIQDLRHTVRTFGASPAFAITAVLVTAIGVGANTAAFSVADHVLLRPLPFPEPASLVRLCEGPRTGGGWGCMNELSPANYRDFKSMSGSFATLGAFYRSAVNLVGAGDPQRVAIAYVTPEVLPLLGITPVLGRVPDSAPVHEENAAAVIGFGLWQSRFGGDQDVIGRTVNLDGAPYEVVGVMPSTFHFPSRQVQLWVPLRLVEADYEDRTNTYIEGIGRLWPGISLDQARADLSVAAARLAQDFPETNTETGTSLFRLRDELAPRYRTLLLALCGASLCILILTCANLANLLLVRGAARERELAVRAALGAGKERLVRQMVTESVALAVVGGLAGVLVSFLVVPLLARLVPGTLPIADRPGVDLRVLMLAASFTGLTGLGFGLLPALRVGRRPGLDALREGSRAGGGRRQRVRRALVITEVAVSVVLLISAGLLIRAVLRVQAVDPGFTPGGVLTMRTALPRPKYDDPVRRAEFYDEVLSEVRALPGVEGAAYTTGLPLVMGGGIWKVTIPGGGEAVERAARFASLRFVTPQYFRTLGIPLLGGRDVAEQDTGESPFVAVVSESFARRYWPGGDPIGRSFQIAFQDRTVVGVVGDIMVRGRERPSEPQVYLPAAQVEVGGLITYDPKDLVIRHAGAGGAILLAVRRIIRAADPAQPISDVRSLDDVVAGETAPRRAQLTVLAALAAVALLLSGVGIHGLLAYSVSQRFQEIGVRLALGAEPSSLARMIVGEGMRLAFLGVIPGLLVAYLAARAMSALLFGVDPADPATLAVAAGLAFATTLAGSLFPARRAVRVNPMTVLRSE